MRELIEQGLAGAGGRPDVSPAANVEGPLSAEMRELIERPMRAAAVLVPLVERATGLRLLFTQRARHLVHHPGQVSFPGGRIADSRESAVDAALREAWEEVGLPPAEVRIAGMLPRHVTGTGFIVTPVVGFVPGAFRPRPDPAEVEAVFEVPLERVLDPGALRAAYRERLGTRFKMYELEHDGRVIWGATAAILVTFRDLLYAAKTR